jgi:hypothetical protein
MLGDVDPIGRHCGGDMTQTRDAEMKTPANRPGLSVQLLEPQHSRRGVFSLDDVQRCRIERECRPRHNQDVCHGTSPAVTRPR